MYLTINGNSKFKIFDTQEYIDINELKNKKFIIYPLIFSPNINISNNKMYLNFTIKNAMIKIIDETTTENIDIIYNDAVNAFNKYI